MSLIFFIINSTKKFIIFIVLVFLCLFFGLGQNHGKIDSLLTELNNSPHDTLKIKTLFELGNQFLDGPSDSLLFYYFKALAVIDSTDSRISRSKNLNKNEELLTIKKLRFRAIINIGIEYFFLGKYSQAIDYYNKALEIATELNDKNLISEVHGELGIVFKNQGEYAQALEHYKIALSTAIELKDTSWIAVCYANTGNVYRRLANYPKALDYFLKALEVFEQKGETRRIAIGYINIGNLYEDQNDFNTAMEYYSRALQLSYQSDDKRRISECLMNIGNVYARSQNYKKAREYFSKSLKINTEMGFYHTLDDCYKYIGNTYEKEGKYKLAIEYYNKSWEIAEKENDKISQSQIYGYLANIYLLEKNFNKALEYANKSQVLNLETGDQQNLKNTYYYLSSAWEGLGNYSKALDYYKKHTVIKDSIFSSEKYRSIKDIEMKYETEKKEQQLALLTQKNQLQLLKFNRRNRLFVSSLIVVILILIIGYILFRNNHLKAKHKSVELEQKLFRSQMNPHFIFNSLIAIQSYIYKKEPVLAGDYLAKFADLVRITLENSRIEFVKLENEVKMLKIYLDLQALRFDNKFDYRIDVDSLINAEKIMIPPMLAQPFVENSIEHGLRYRKEKGNLQISFKKLNRAILCSIEDNGVGREKSRELNKKRQHQSMATSITKERLKVVSKKFRKKYSLEITDLKDKNGLPAGTRVIINMPFKV